MKKVITFILVISCIFNLVGCAGKTIGNISGPENECITIDNTTYILNTMHNYSSADKGTYLGNVSNSKITMRVYTVKGDTNGEYIYTLWDWEGAFYKREN